MDTAPWSYDLVNMCIECVNWLVYIVWHSISFVPILHIISLNIKADLCGYASKLQIYILFAGTISR